MTTPSDHLDLTLRRPKPLVWSYLAVAGVLTLGVVPVLLGLLWGIAWLRDTRPARLDREGLTTRRGRRLPWSGLVAIEPHAEYRRVAGRSVPTRWFLVLAVADARVALQPDLFEQQEQTILTCLERCVGRAVPRAPWNGESS